MSWIRKIIPIWRNGLKCNTVDSCLFPIQFVGSIHVSSSISFFCVAAVDVLLHEGIVASGFDLLNLLYATCLFAAELSDYIWTCLTFVPKTFNLPYILQLDL